VLSGADSGLAVTLDGRGIVGRAKHVEVKLEDPTISEFHLELVAGPSGIAVRDLGSLNGVYLRDTLLRDGIVPDRTELSLGATIVRLTLGEGFTAEISKALSFGQLVGSSTRMREMFALLERVSKTDLAVLIEGDAGTGKETIARAIAAAMSAGPEPRRVDVVDCPTLPHHLAEGALVGPGGALALSKGAALLLEDVAELTAAAQSALARALGSREPDRPRLLTTSRVDLRTRVNAGTFREDLYHLLAEARIRVPALRERREDVRPLVQYFLSQIPWETTAARSIERDALDTIAEQDFPGNVRELRALVERVAKIAEGSTITMADLDFARLVTATADRSDDAEPTPEKNADEPLLAFKDAKRSVVDEFERAYLTRLLARAGTNISRAASIAGIERQSMRALLRRHGLRGEE
jgi:DNA-binding NtrC family response regulator